MIYRLRIACSILRVGVFLLFHCELLIGYLLLPYCSHFYFLVLLFNLLFRLQNFRLRLSQGSFSRVSFFLLLFLLLLVDCLWLSLFTGHLLKRLLVFLSKRDWFLRRSLFVLLILFNRVRLHLFLLLYHRLAFLFHLCFLNRLLFFHYLCLVYFFFVILGVRLVLLAPCRIWLWQLLRG